MVLCQIVATDCLMQRVVITRFITDQEAIEKSKILYNKGFLPFIVPPCV